MALLTLLAFVLAVFATALTARLRERHLRVWHVALTPSGPRATELELESRAISRQLDTIDDVVRLAHLRRSRGEFHEARSLLDLACRTIEAFVPGRRAQLFEMVRVSRAISAMLPLQASAASAFSSPAVSGLMALGRAARLLLVTAGERFRLQARLIACAFGLVAKRVRFHTKRAHRSEHWPPIAALHSDLAALSRESLDCYRVLLLSLDREELNEFVEDLAA